MTSTHGTLSWKLRSSTSRSTVSCETTILAGNPKPNTDSKHERIECRGGWLEWKRIVLQDGKSAGLECLTINTGAVEVTILPDRGMGLWKCWTNHLELGWQSPVAGPVHPSLVPVHDATGIGWLEGFDELLVRCGLYSNGAPEFHANGTLRHPLHGRIANLPASDLEITVDAENGILDVVGVVSEARFLIYSLELQTRYRFRAGSPVIEVTDIVTNCLSKPGSMQMLYHINLGDPIVDAGATIHAPIRNMIPRDARAKEGIDHWNICEAPASGFQEQVYLITPAADAQGWSEVMLSSADKSLGCSVQFDTQTLPYLNVWKNTAAREDGNVVGLEPATGFPNPRSIEEEQGRVVQLAAGESKAFQLRFVPLATSQDVAQAKARIDAIAGRAK
jgi:hypothetical protein